jgi:hypothetical protein
VGTMAVGLVVVPYANFMSIATRVGFASLALIQLSRRIMGWRVGAQPT